MTAKASIKCGADLWDASRAKAKAEGYPSFNSYITALMRLDILNEASDHKTAQKIAAMPDAKRDRIDAMMLEKAEQALTRWKLVDPVEIAEREVHARLTKGEGVAAS